jgi:hypothetical protein
MDVWITRRKMLALSAVGALAATLPSCSSHHRHSSAPQTSNPPPNDDEYELDNEGYDPQAGEPATPEPPRRPGEVPRAASVRTEWLPPVGRQTVSNCFVWSTVYGLATFYAARKSQIPPTTPDLQAAPDYTYVR